MATRYQFVDDSGETRLAGFLVPEPGGSLPSEWTVGAEGSLHITQGEGTPNAITLYATGSADAMNNFLAVFENAGNLGLDFGPSGLHVFESTNGNTVLAITEAGHFGFFGATPAAQPTGVAVTAAAIHAALVTLGLITA